MTTKITLRHKRASKRCNDGHNREILHDGSFHACRAHFIGGGADMEVNIEAGSITARLNLANAIQLRDRLNDIIADAFESQSNAAKAGKGLIV